MSDWKKKSRRRREEKGLTLDALRSTAWRTVVRGAPREILFPWQIQEPWEGLRAAHIQQSTTSLRAQGRWLKAASLTSKLKWCRGGGREFLNPHKVFWEGTKLLTNEHQHWDAWGKCNEKWTLTLHLILLYCLNILLQWIFLCYYLNN